jgi:hypothetical protein
MHFIDTQICGLANIEDIRISFSTTVGDIPTTIQNNPLILSYLLENMMIRKIYQIENLIVSQEQLKALQQDGGIHPLIKLTKSREQYPDGSNTLIDLTSTTVAAPPICK